MAFTDRHLGGTRALVSINRAIAPVAIASALTLFLAPTSGAQPISPPPAPPPVPAPLGVPASPLVDAQVVAKLQWGQYADGERWHFVERGQVLADDPNLGTALTAPPGSDPQARSARSIIAECEVIVADLELTGLSFYWSTTQSCTGDYGTQDTSTQLQRTSWRGWLGYTPWSTLPTIPTAVPLIVFTWTADCAHESGIYDYRAAAQGWSSTIGLSPVVYSEDSDVIGQADCGPGVG